MSRSLRHSVVATLADGTRLELRPIGPDDKPLLVEGYRRLSPRARYLRFFAAADELSRSQLAYLTEIDQRHHVAVGVLHDGEPVAVGRFVRLLRDPYGADVALTVLDAYQGRGIGRLLLETLAAVARIHGLERLHFDVLPENAAMLALLDRVGAMPRLEDGLVHAVVEVDAIPTPAFLRGDPADLVPAAILRAG